MKFKIHKSLVCSALLLLAACSNYVDEYEDEWKDAFDNENASVDPSDPEALDISSSSNADKPVKLSSSSAAVKPGSSEAKSTSSSSVTESSSSVAASSVTETSSSSEQPSSSSAITSSAAQNSSGSVASSSSAQSSNSQTSSSSVASSSSVTSSASLSFHWDGFLAASRSNYRVYTSGSKGGDWKFNFGNNIARRLSYDDCAGLCALVYYRDYTGNDYYKASFEFDVNEGNNLDVSSWNGLCITYYSDGAGKLMISHDDFKMAEDNYPYIKLPKTENSHKILNIPWNQFIEPFYKLDDGVLEYATTVKISFEANPGDKHFYDIYEIGSYGECNGDKDRQGYRNFFNADSLYLDSIKPSWKHLYQNSNGIGAVDQSNFKTIVDNKDGTEYKTIEIGEQIWLAENMNYDSGDYQSACFNDDSTKCAEYGRLYDYAMALNVCPDHFTLPKAEDYEKLKTYIMSTQVGASAVAGLLKTYKEWPRNVDYVTAGNTNHFNETGFSAYPVGYFDMSESTQWLHNTDEVHFWVNRGEDVKFSYMVIKNENDYFRSESVTNTNNYKFSVRCIKE